MNAWCAGRFALTMFLVFSSGASAQETQKTPHESNLKIVISVTKETFEIGEPILVSIVVTSSGGRETTPTWGTSPEADFVPVVVGWDREDPPLTAQGIRWTKRAFREAAGEEEFGDEPRTFVIDLNSFYDLGKGGTFDLSVTRQITKGAAFPRYVKSQELRFRVGAARSHGEEFRLRKTKAPLSAFEIGRWGPEKCGLQLAARLRNETIRAGEKVVIDVYIRNRSEAAINLLSNSPYWYALDIRDSEGRPIDESTALRDLPMESGSMNRNLIAPGGCLVGSFNPPSRYSFDKPGRYTISVSRDVTSLCAAISVLETEPLELEVRE